MYKYIYLNPNFHVYTIIKTAVFTLNVGIKDKINITDVILLILKLVLFII